MKFFINVKYFLVGCLTVFAFTFPIFSQEDSFAFAMRLESALSRGDLQTAVNMYEELSPDLANDKSLRIIYASLLISTQQNEKANSVISKLKSEFPSDIEILELVAHAALSSGNKAAINAAVKDLLVINPNNAVANIILADQQSLAKKYKLAARYYLKALTDEPENEEALLGYAKMCYYTNDLEISRRNFEKLLSLNPHNSDAFYYLGKLTAETESYLTALKYVKKAIEINDSNYDYYIDSGQYERYCGNFAAAEKEWTKAIELEPDYFLAYTYRAGLYDEQNKIKEALADYRKILETNPKYYFAFEQMGVLEFYLEDWAAARKSFSSADSIRPHIAYKLMIILTFFKEKKNMEGKEYCTKLMKTLNRESLDYKMVRLFHDMGGINAENAISKDLEKESDKTRRGKMMYYFGQYYELNGMEKVAKEYYARITNMNTPMFFEYRLAEWGMNK